MTDPWRRPGARGNRRSPDRLRRPSKQRNATLTFAAITLALGGAFVALLWVSSYAKVRPTLGGFPFFYWYSLLWLVITTAAQFLAYQLLVARPRRRARWKAIR